MTRVYPMSTILLSPGPTPWLVRITKDSFNARSKCCSSITLFHPSHGLSLIILSRKCLEGFSSLQGTAVKQDYDNCQ